MLINCLVAYITFNIYKWKTFLLKDYFSVFFSFTSFLLSYFCFPSHLLYCASSPFAETFTPALCSLHYENIMNTFSCAMINFYQKSVMSVGKEGLQTQAYSDSELSFCPLHIQEINFSHVGQKTKFSNTPENSKT